MTGVRIPIGHGSRGRVTLVGRYANRHALIAGATGTGKTTTLATVAEGFSAAGVPVAIADVKGDLAGLARAVPAALLDPFGKVGAPARLDLWRMGPDLIARALELSDAQSGALDVAFAVADAQGLALSDLSDLRQLLRLLAADHRAVSESVGLVTPSSLAAVQRAALRLEREAAGAFGRPALDVAAFEQHASDGRGVVSILAAAGLARTPGLYGAMCAFILSDLYARVPEVGDLDRPRLALMLDEAHLIFEGAPAALVRQMESVVRLIRSKGVALIFVTQSPADLPAGVLGQLQNRIQHGLRGATPADLRAIRAAADTMPAPRGFNAARAIEGLGVGEALVSAVGPDGRPGLADLVKVARCRADLSPLSPDELAALLPEPAPPPPPVEPTRDRRPARFPVAMAATVGALALILALVTCAA